MTLDELLERVASERRTGRYAHVLGSPASRARIDDWKAAHPSHPLPRDLEALVARVDGIHLWADRKTGRSYEGLAPIEEWDIARAKMYGEGVDPTIVDDRFIAITYHQDFAAFVVLDTKSGTYFLMDTAGPDESSPIANSVETLLDWLWSHRIEPQ
jgi:hypothetical protein